MLYPREKIYTNDLDGNLLKSRTPFYYEAKQFDGSWPVIEVPAYEVDANPKKFENRNQYRYVDGDISKTYQHFHDFHTDFRHQGPDRFMKDIAYAIDNGEFAPSYASFINDVLVKGNLFLILTARAIGSDNLKRGIRLMNDKSLTYEQRGEQSENIRKIYGWEKLSDKAALDKYYDINWFIGANNAELQKYMGTPIGLSSAEKKVRFMGRYTRYITKFIKKYQPIDTEHRVKLGFSDDHKDNALKMLEYFMKSSSKQTSPYNYYDYTVYCTSEVKEVRDEVRNQTDLLLKKYGNISLDIKEQNVIVPKQQNIIIPIQSEIQSILKIDVSRMAA